MLGFVHGHSASLQAVLMQPSKCCWMYLWALSLQIFLKAVVRAVWCFLMACSSSHSLFCLGYVLAECAELAPSTLQMGQLRHRFPMLCSPPIQLLPV